MDKQNIDDKPFVTIFKQEYKLETETTIEDILKDVIRHIKVLSKEIGLSEYSNKRIMVKNLETHIRFKIHNIGE